MDECWCISFLLLFEKLPQNLIVLNNPHLLVVSYSLWVMNVGPCYVSQPFIRLSSTSEVSLEGSTKKETTSKFIPALLTELSFSWLLAEGPQFLISYSLTHGPLRYSFYSLETDRKRECANKTEGLTFTTLSQEWYPSCFPYSVY